MRNEKRIIYLTINRDIRSLSQDKNSLNDFITVRLRFVLIFSRDETTQIFYS